MMNGHSFVAVFQDLTGAPGIDDIAMQSEPTGASQPHAADTVPPVPPDPEDSDDPAEPHFEAHESEEESTTPSSSSFDEEDLQGLQVFGLAQRAHHCFVRWTTYTGVLLDVLVSIGLHRDFAIGFHSLQAALVDQHAAEEAIILQRVGDVPAGSSYQLGLVDIVTHCPTTNSQRAQREVHLLPPQLCRQGLILELGLQNSCVLGDQTDHCTIYHNNILWEPLDFGPRDLLHGAYLRVVIGAPVRKSSKTAASQSTTTECQTEERPTKFSRSRTPAASSMSSMQGLRLHQSSTQLHRQKSLPLIQHSATYPSLGYVHPGVVAQHSTGQEWEITFARRMAHTSPQTVH